MADAPEALLSAFDVAPEGSEADTAVYELVQVHELPPWYTHAPFVQTGYRRCRTVGSCSRSVFKLHNESVSIWLHLPVSFLLLPYLLYVLQQLTPRERGRAWPPKPAATGAPKPPAAGAAAGAPNGDACGGEDGAWPSAVSAPGAARDSRVRTHAHDASRCAASTRTGAAPKAGFAAAAPKGCCAPPKPAQRTRRRVSRRVAPGTRRACNARTREPRRRAGGGGSREKSGGATARLRGKHARRRRRRAETRGGPRERAP